MDLEERLASWTEPSSSTEQDKQERSVRMIDEAIKEHPAFEGVDLSVYAKGSYPNNTNVKFDSDVDVGVQCHEVFYHDATTPAAEPPPNPYRGHWKRDVLRNEVTLALVAKFPGQVDTSGSTALRVRSSTARVDADVVPCFNYRYYTSPGSYREGVRIFRTSGQTLVNYPVQQLENGRAKNKRTQARYKKVVRILKRAANEMESGRTHRSVPSFFIESLVYNCPDHAFGHANWRERVQFVLAHIWEGLQSDAEPTAEEDRWVEVNGYKFLFHPDQKWNRADGRDFAYAAWNYLGLAS